MIAPQTVKAIDAFITSDLGQATIRPGYTDVVKRELEFLVALADPRRWRMDPDDATCMVNNLLNNLLGTLDSAGYFQEPHRDARHNPELWDAVRVIVDVEVNARRGKGRL